MKNNENKEFLNSILSNSLGSKNYSSDISFNHFEDYKKELLEKHKNQSLYDIEGSIKNENDYGFNLKITSSEKIDFHIMECNFKENLSKNLKLIPGVGPSKEEKLKEKGFNDLKDLSSHKTYSNSAEKLLNIIENNSFFEIFKLLKENKYSKECKDNLIKSLSLVESENFKFMDIETLGLLNCPIILIGVAEIKKDNIITSQYFLEDKSQEKSVISSYLSHIDEDSIHVTFNGASFDIPFIKNRASYYNLDCNLNHAHFDLVHPARSLWKNKLPNCKLTTIEKEIFNMKRENDVPGSEIPDYYETYLNKNNIGPVIPIIEHHRQDIVSLASFLMKIYYETLNNLG
ncbi:MAG: ribonuclease H-like domain-containing protein [Methanobacteriaceae archaeon]|jgi:hypothetical protein|nr:ribonuclease H-like domain-containing protein [Methanobacteriaceae archaeon]